MKRIVLLAMLVATSALAQVCSASALAGELQYFRRLSLDLRGRVPTEAELDGVRAASAVNEAALDDLMTRTDLKKQVRAWVRGLLYSNLRLPLSDNFQLTTVPQATADLPATDSLFVPNRAQNYRPLGQLPAPQRRPCLDVDQATLGYDPSGRPLTSTDAEGYVREGWVRLHPYWDPDPTHLVKVCAFDAQAFATSSSPAAVGCHRFEASFETSCGCGPDLRHCQAAYVDGTTLVSTETTINGAIVEQAVRIAERIIDDGRPWSDVLTTREVEVNGALAHYLRWQAATTTDFDSRGDLGFTVPSKSFTDTSWTKVLAGGRASGVLTTPHYLLKFASNRARANHFLNTFACTALQAPPGGLPASTDACSREPNLQLRCGCSSCHRALEPRASAWGRYAERGTFELTDAEFPDVDSSCVVTDGGAASYRCEKYYRPRALDVSESPAVGKLKWLLYAEGQGLQNFATGPSALAQAIIDDGSFAQCTVRRQWERLVGRPFLESLPDERAMLDLLTAQFISSHHDLPLLLKRIVQSQHYRHPETKVEGLSP